MSDDDQIAEWRERVGKPVQHRRESRYRNMREAAKTAGISETLWGEVERGYKIISATERRAVSPLPRSLRYIATALGWRDDAIELLQQGLIPVELPLTPHDRGLEDFTTPPEFAGPTPGLKPTPSDDDGAPLPATGGKPLPRTGRSYAQILQQLDTFLDQLVEKVRSLSWQNRVLVDQYADELLADEAQAWFELTGVPEEPPADEPEELRDAKDELALAAAGEIDLDPATKAALEQVVRDTLDESE